MVNRSVYTAVITIVILNSDGLTFWVVSLKMIVNKAFLYFYLLLGQLKRTYT